MTKSESNSELIAVRDLSVHLGQISAPLAIISGSDLSYVFANDLYHQLLNHEQIIGKKVDEIFSQNLHYENLLRSAFSKEKIFHYQQSSQHQSNKPIQYFNLVHFPIKGQNGAVEAIMIIGEEVKKVENKENQNASHFRNIVENSSAAIVILLGEDLVLDVANDAVLKLWGVTRDAIGKPFLDILPEMKEQGFHDLLIDVYKNGNTHYGYERLCFLREQMDRIKYITSILFISLIARIMER